MLLPFFLFFIHSYFLLFFSIFLSIKAKNLSHCFWHHFALHFSFFQSTLNNGDGDAPPSHAAIAIPIIHLPTHPREQRRTSFSTCRRRCRCRRRWLLISKNKNFCVFVFLSLFLSYKHTRTHSLYLSFPNSLILSNTTHTHSLSFSLIRSLTIK